MPAAEGEQPTTRKLQRPAVRPVVWLACGALSGVLVACLIKVASWLFLEGPPAFVRTDSSGRTHFVDSVTLEYWFLLARSLLNVAPKGLPSGLLGGAFTVLFLLYWKRGARLFAVTLFWTLFAGSFGLLAGLLVLDTHNDLARLAQQVSWTGATGAAFGFLQAALARPLERLLGPGTLLSEPEA